MLTLEGLRIEQGGFRLSADLQVAPGALVAVIGPSGAGKSTLLATIAGFLVPASGRVLWNGADITEAEPGQRSLSIIFQDNNLLPHLTAAQNIGLGLRPSLRLSDAESARVSDSLARVGLAGLGERKPAAMSGGQQSRVALARALLRARPCMLLDEPFAALGPAQKTEMLELVKQLATDTGAAVLMVTHDPQDALRLGGQTILVADGVAHPPQDTGGLIANPPEALRAYLD
ncbi:MAG: ATP-binding cassette domain-containing protein [Rhodobacteraceae bacterium]|nr:ATP-binding cassette domain-containing protein [Paracoccaceae bacterium]